MIALLLAIVTIALPQAPAPAIAGHWRLESYTRERLVGERGGSPLTVTESLVVSQTLDITVAGATITVTMTVTDRRMLGVGTIDRYELDGQPHQYEWGDVIPRTIGTRSAAWNTDGFAISERPRQDSEPREVRFMLSADNRRLAKTIAYPPSAAPTWTRPVVRDALVFVREP